MSATAFRAAGALLLVLLAATASAQTPSGRFSIAAGGGAQSAAPGLGDRFEFEHFVETGSADVDYAADAGPLVDLGFAMRVRPRIGAGVSLTYAGGDRRARVSGRIPHPFAFGQFRDVEGEAPRLDRSELGVHVHLGYTRPLARRLHVTLSGGPSFVRVTQQLVEQVLFTHTFPYDTATFTGVDSRRATGSGAGFHAGMDVTWMVARRVGVGALVRYTRATVDLKASGGRKVSADAGGLHSAGGLRLYF